MSDVLSLTDLVECNYSGYTPQASNMWTGPFSEMNGDRYLLSPVFTFAFTAGPTTNVAYGYFLTITISSIVKLLYARRLPSPQGMNYPGNSFPARPKLSVRALIF